MKNRIVLLASLALLATPFAAQAPAKVPSEFSTLVPSDSVVFVQLRSLEELAGLVGRFQGGAEGEAPGVQELIESLELPGNAALVDPKGTFGFALGLSPQTMSPTPVFLVPTTDPKAFTESLGMPPGQVRSAGSFVAVAMQGMLGAAGDGALLGELEDGLVSARVDLATLLQTFGPMIQMGLSMAEQQMDQAMAQAGAATPFDPTEVMGLYFDFLRDFLASAVRLELVLDTHGTQAELRGGFWNKEGSPLAGWAKAEDVDFAALARRLDAEAALQFVGAFDLSSMMEEFLPMYESMLTNAVEQGGLAPEFSAAFHTYLEAARNLMPLMSTNAGSIDLAPEGMRGTFAYGSSDPQKLLQGWLALGSDPALSALGV